MKFLSRLPKIQKLLGDGLSALSHTPKLGMVATHPFTATTYYHSTFISCGEPWTLIWVLCHLIWLSLTGGASSQVREDHFHIWHGEPFTDRKSTFQAHVVEVHTKEEVSFNLRFSSADVCRCMGESNSSFPVWKGYMCFACNTRQRHYQPVLPSLEGYLKWSM